jgi:hypothetical protein
LLFTLAALLAAPARAGDPDPDAPPANQPPPVNFSGAVGQYAIVHRAAPTEVHVEEPLTLTITITGKGPAKHLPRREGLDKVFPPDFDRDFYIEPVPSKDVIDPLGGKWEFVYRLRPRHLRANYIPELAFSYYDPARKGYQTARARPEIELTVKERQKAEVTPAASRALEPPAHFYCVATGPGVLARAGDGPGVVGLAALVLVPPLLCCVGYALWRRLYPDADREARRRRSRAAQQALKALAALRSGDGAGAAGVLAHYLRARTDLRVLEPTPLEIEGHLTRVGLPPQTAGRVAGFFRACDTARFAPAAAGTALASEAVAVVELLEGELCPSPRS